jgi:hypothetical protein
MNLKHSAGLLFILLSLTWGCNQNAAEETEVSPSEEVRDQAPVQSPEKKEVPPMEIDASGGVNASGTPDAFGRQPGDEHYGHSHATQENQTNSPVIAPSGTVAPTGGPDAFGRQPGEEHYGHSHE